MSNGLRDSPRWILPWVEASKLTPPTSPVDPSVGCPTSEPPGAFCERLKLLVAPLVVNASLVDAREVRLGSGVDASSVTYALRSGAGITFSWQRLPQPMVLEFLTQGRSEDRYEQWDSGSEVVHVDHSTEFKQIILVRSSGTMLNVRVELPRRRGPGG